MEEEIKGRCPFRDKFTARVCGMPLIYDSKYEVYKCSVHNHYAVSKAGYERKWGLEEQKDAVTPSGNDEKRRRKR